MVTAAVPEEAAALARAPARTARGTTPAVAQEAAALSLPDNARSRLLAERLTVLFAGASLLHARPASMEQARAHHHEHGAHWTWPLVRWLRIGWGYAVHLPYRVLALALDLVLSSPAATVIVAALAFAFWRWH